MKDDEPTTQLDFTNMSPTDLSNTLVWFGSQLQRWASSRTPGQNEYHINFSQVSLLYLVRYGLTTPGAVAKRMMVTPRAVTTHVDVLVEKGLLERQSDPHDRRLVRLSLTSEGERISRSVEEIALLPLVECIEALSPDDQEAIARTVNVLRSFFHHLRNPSDEP